VSIRIHAEESKYSARADILESLYRFSWPGFKDSLTLAHLIYKVAASGSEYGCLTPK
jgi:hypothetical protein